MKTKIPIIILFLALGYTALGAIFYFHKTPVSTQNPIALIVNKDANNFTDTQITKISENNSSNNKTTTYEIQPGGLGITPVSPEIGFKTGIKEYSLLKWKNETMKEENPRASIDIQYPQFIGLNTKNLNKYINDLTVGKVTEYKNSIKEWEAKNPNSIPDSGSIIYLSSQYRIIGVSKGIVSLELVVTDFTGGGNGNHDEPYTINWDLKSNRLLQPEELFCSKNYLSILSPIVREGLIKYLLSFKNFVQPIPEDTMNWIGEGTAPSADNLNNFLIAPKGLIVVFPPYQVFSGSEGIVHVLIPSSSIPNLLCLP